MGESDDLRQFMRDIALRHERIWREQAGMLSEMRIELRDLRHVSQAQTSALLHVLDELRSGPAGA